MSRRRSRRFLLAGLGAAGLGAATLAGCGPAGGDRWAHHAPGSPATVDHRAWQLFLDRRTFVGADGVTRVAYAEVTPADRDMLAEYVAGLERVPVERLARAEQLAFWLNLHNALIVLVDIWQVIRSDKVPVLKVGGDVL